MGVTAVNVHVVLRHNMTYLAEVGIWRLSPVQQWSIVVWRSSDQWTTLWSVSAHRRQATRKSELKPQESVWCDVPPVVLNQMRESRCSC